MQVAQQAADIVILDDNFQSIVAAVKWYTVIAFVKFQADRDRKGGTEGWREGGRQRQRGREGGTVGGREEGREAGRDRGGGGEDRERVVILDDNFQSIVAAVKWYTVIAFVKFQADRDREEEREGGRQRQEGREGGREEGGRERGTKREF